MHAFQFSVSLVQTIDSLDFGIFWGGHFHMFCYLALIQHGKLKVQLIRVVTFHHLVAFVIHFYYEYDY